MARPKPAETGLKPLKEPVRYKLVADQGWKQRWHLLYQDLQEAAKLYRLIWALAFSDIKLRYRGSVIGPFWMTLSTGVQIAAMSFVYSYLFHMSTRSYMTFLCISLIIWNFLSSLIVDACTCFVVSEGLIKNTRLPLAVHAARSVVRDVIIFGHNVIIVVIFFAIVQVHQSFASLYAIPGLLLWLIDGFALALALGAVCARFRDIPQIISAAIQIIFFITPIMWLPDIIKAHHALGALIYLNPFVYLLDIIRDPLLGQPLAMAEVSRALAVSAVIVVASLFVFARTRGRIAFWI